MFGTIVCMIACFLVGVVCTWAWHEYRDSPGAMSAIWAWELLCLAVTLFMFFPRQF